MKIRRGRALGATATVAVTAILLSGCSALGISEEGPGGESSVLTIGRGNDIATLDAQDTINATEQVLVNIYDYLIWRDFEEGGEVVYSPRLAAEWSQTGDRTWEFKLRDDVEFSNGEAFTAEDVEFSIERTKSDETLAAHTKYERIESVNVIDDYTIEFTTTDNAPGFLNTFVDNGAGILPKDTFEAAASAEEFFSNPVGSGAYQFVSWAQGSELVLKKNENWWGGDPKWDEVKVRAISETSTRVAEFLTGTVDVAENVPPDENERIDSNEGTGTASTPIGRIYELEPRIEEGAPTGDVRVRQAISLAIDRQEIADLVLRGHGTATRGYFPPLIPGWSEELETDVPFDPEAAKALLAEAGYGEGDLKLTISTPNGRWLKDKEIAEASAGYLNAVGIETNVEVLDWTVFNDRKSKGELGDLVYWGMGTRSDSSEIFNYLGYVTSYVNWTDPEYERLAEAAAATESSEELYTLADDAQHLLSDQAVRITLGYLSSNWGVNDRVQYEPRFDDLIVVEDIVAQ